VNDATFTKVLDERAEVVMDFLREHGEEDIAEHLHLAATLVVNRELLRDVLRAWLIAVRAPFSYRPETHPMEIAQVELLLSLLEKEN
jgi:hypothetical protein